MTIDDRIIELENRITKLNDDIKDIDLKLVEQKAKFRRVHEKAESLSQNYGDLIDFVNRNDPTGINLYDKNHTENETLSSTINSANNQQLYQFKKELEEARLQYNKAKQLRATQTKKIEDTEEQVYEIDSERRQTSNRYAARAQKYDARYQKEKYRKGGRLIYIPLAVIAFLAGCTISLPVGLLGIALAIAGTAVVREIKRRNIVKNTKDKSYDDMTKKERKAYEVEATNQAYKTAKSKAKPAYQQSLSSQYENATTVVDSLNKKKEIDNRILTQKEEAYDKAIKKFNSFLSLCQNKQTDLQDTKRRLAEVKNVEDGIIEIMNTYNEVKQDKQEEIAQRKQEIENIKNGTTTKNDTSSKTEDSGKGKRS